MMRRRAAAHHQEMLHSLDACRMSSEEFEMPHTLPAMLRLSQAPGSWQARDDQPVGLVSSKELFPLILHDHEGESRGRSTLKSRA